PNYSFVHNATIAPSTSYYDYIIVGGGTAGCPLAATLSQNSTVLLLERGGSPYGNSNITLLSSFGSPLSDPSPTSPSQRFISTDGVINARARVLGGGSCLNAGFYSRAGPAYVQGVGWDPRLVNESYHWVEEVVAFEPPMRAWQSAVRDGLIEAGVVPFNGFTFDHVNGTKVGGTIFDRDGNRHTAADLLGYANPQGLNVLLHATVSKILFRTTGVARPQAQGVVFKDSAGVQHRAYLKSGPKNEVIISAGSLGSPQLLMLSGIGPAEHLKAHNISLLLDQPMVGQGMSDNPMNAIYIPSPLPVEVSLIQVVGITPFGSYIEAASGENFGGRTTHPRDFGMLSPKERTPEALAEAIEQMSNLPDIAFQGGFILEKIMGPLSSGHLELESLDPDANPSVTFNYFKEPEDLERCVEGLQTIEKVINSQAFNRFKYEGISVQTLLNMTASNPVNMLPHHANVSMSLEQFCKDTVMTIWHYHGGCQVGRVVDSDYKVIGIDSLRVIDGSTFHFSP
ncbi:Protein HOTHEAD, partial [Bienertia sinuspersici]